MINVAANAGFAFADAFFKSKVAPIDVYKRQYRSSAALLGIAFIQNIYGNAGMAPVMIIGSVPLYNVMAVIVLSFFKPGQNGIRCV